MATEELFFTDDPKLKMTRCIYNEEQGYSITINAIDGYHVEIEPYDAMIWEDWRTPIVIPFNDAVEILKNNRALFDISDNKPTQCVTFFLVGV